MDVVPEVNWMLTMSWLESGDEGVGGADWEEELLRTVNGVVARRGPGSMRPEALSTRTMCWREGTVSDWRVEA